MTYKRHGTTTLFAAMPRRGGDRANTDPTGRSRGVSSRPDQPATKARRRNPRQRLLGANRCDPYNELGAVSHDEYCAPRLERRGPASEMDEFLYKSALEIRRDAWLETFCVETPSVGETPTSVIIGRDKSCFARAWAQGHARRGVSRSTGRSQIDQQRDCRSSRSLPAKPPQATPRSLYLLLDSMRPRGI